MILPGHRRGSSFTCPHPLAFGRQETVHRGSSGHESIVRRQSPRDQAHPPLTACLFAGITEPAVTAGLRRLLESTVLARAQDLGTSWPADSPAQNLTSALARIECQGEGQSRMHARLHPADAGWFRASNLADRLALTLEFWLSRGERERGRR